RGGVPSSTATAWSRNSGAPRTKACTGKSGTWMQAKSIGIGSSGHRVIGSSGEVKSPDDPMTRWPDHPILVLFALCWKFVTTRSPSPTDLQVHMNSVQQAGARGVPALRSLERRCRRPLKGHGNSLPRHTKCRPWVAFEMVAAEMAAAEMRSHYGSLIFCGFAPMGGLRGEVHHQRRAAFRMRLLLHNHQRSCGVLDRAAKAKPGSQRNTTGCSHRNVPQ